VSHYIHVFMYVARIYVSMNELCLCHTTHSNMSHYSSMYESYSTSLSPYNSLSLSFSLSHTHTLSLSLFLSLPLFISLSLSLSCARSFSFSLFVPLPAVYALRTSCISYLTYVKCVCYDIHHPLYRPVHIDI